MKFEKLRENRGRLHELVQLASYVPLAATQFSL